MANVKRYKRLYEKHYRALITKAKEKKIPVSITYEEYFDIIKDNECFYCKDSLGLFKRPTKSRIYALDRIDGTGVYSKENVIPCCTSCNMTRRDLYTFEEFSMMAPIIKYIKESRKNGKIIRST